MDVAKLIIVFASCLLMFTSCCHSSSHFNKQSTSLFIFGDSLFDPGNNNYINTTISLQANFTPYGISYFHPPSGRFSNGRVIPDFIAEFASLPLIPAYFNPQNREYSYGANFASGGSGALVETVPGLVMDLKSQLRCFGDLRKQLRKRLGDEKTEHMLADAVYLLSSGNNDYLSLVSNNNSIYHNYTNEQYVKMVVGNMTRVIKGIHKRGGRKFGILTTMPLACCPGIRAFQVGNTNCNQQLGILTSLHNQILSKKLKKLEKKLDGFKYANFDISTAVSNRMKNPSKYGFKVSDSACCGSGPFRGINSCGGKRGIKEFELCDNINDYVFFDALHPTEVANRQYAKLFWNGDSNVTTPYNLKTLFQGEQL
uniref:GDSL lipase-like n=1 Tax=Erigeron canadensis TaxID=72917 RepID=UPI001CB9B90D|nr:GDSL lipase-like [Erigeron canadensis]